MLDRRTRHDADTVHVTPSEFFTTTFRALAEQHGALVAAGITTLDAPPLTFETDGAAWTIRLAGDTIEAVGHHVSGAMVLSLTDEQFSLWAQQHLSFNGMTVARSLAMRDGTERDVSVWDSLSLALLEGWPVVGDIEFVDRHGEPLDLQRSFTPDDHPADVAHFLREAGFLHLKGWTDPSLMDIIADDIDQALPEYSPTDGKSWWATLHDGSLVCVRLQEFLEHSPATVTLLSGDGWDTVRRTVGGDITLEQPAIEGRCIEALVKPVGVASGPSDLSFHRDCHLGRHAYGCAGLTVGVSVTGSDPSNGQLRVVAGSHRIAMPVEFAKHESYLPIVAFVTEPGDLTVHLSCTLHEATPPVHTPRKVMYTNFSLPTLPDRGASAATHLEELRERVHVIHRGTTR